MFVPFVKLIIIIILYIERCKKNLIKFIKEIKKRINIGLCIKLNHNFAIVYITIKYMNKYLALNCNFKLNTTGN